MRGAPLTSKEAGNGTLGILSYNKWLLLLGGGLLLPLSANHRPRHIGNDAWSVDCLGYGGRSCIGYASDWCGLRESPNIRFGEGAG